MKEGMSHLNTVSMVFDVSDGHPVLYLLSAHMCQETSHESIEDVLEICWSSFTATKRASRGCQRGLAHD